MREYVMPVGKSDFEKVRTSGDYYIDKTGLITQIMACGAEVLLFTRPRRFGKSLNMSMLQHFFDICEDSYAIFEGLKITKEQSVCDAWMNRYPTIFISFKDVGGINFQDAMIRLKSVISKLYEKHRYLIKDNSNIELFEVKKYNAFLEESTERVDITDALYFLMKLLWDYHKVPVIVLIDEYDVPMAKGDENGYYREMADVMRFMFSKALKDNPYLKKAVMTGCLRIEEESIFTGLNNMSVNTIADIGYEEYFGFTDDEMERLLADTKLESYHSVIKEWYDGYQFGREQIYCPWDVLNYVNELQQNPHTPPVNYWANTSGNDVIKKFLNSNYDVSDDFEHLLRGDSVYKKINPNITYSDLTENEMNLWSILYMTGYLTTASDDEVSMQVWKNDTIKGKYEVPFQLRLPNREIRMLFADTIATWFEEKIKADDRIELFDAVWNEDAGRMTELISDYLYDTISYFDYHENYYHAFLAGLLSGNNNIVKSNDEVGMGRADLIVKNKAKRCVAIFELKRAESEAEMEKLCDVALQQIEMNKYSMPFKRERVIKYGVSFYGKDCLVKKG